MRKLAHIINPVHVAKTSDLFVAQPVTFETMRQAQAAATQVTVDLFAVCYPEDRPIVPDGFVHLPDLTKSVLDYGRFQHPRQLPLLKDILDSLCAATDADYLIYTNVDIGLQPHFYTAVSELIGQGYDAFAINRRTITDRYTTPDEIPLMWGEVGQPHRGWDCFVFPRASYPRYKLGHACIGATRIGLLLLANMQAFARQFHVFKDAHLTFHIGDERGWLNPKYADYDDHNTAELMQVLTALEQEQGAFTRDTIPGSFLMRKRTFGSFYEWWARSVYLPPRLSRLLNRVLSV
ncbi:MAG: hypothetical protein AAF614_12765 [Chloroflexota bacterium]